MSLEPGLGRRESGATNCIIIVPKTGITHSNIAQVAQKTGAAEFHAGLGAVLPYPSRDYAALESEVRKLADQVKEYEGG